jgi:hypothetical protein
MTSDDRLILDFQQGSKEAFTELFERYRDPIYGFSAAGWKTPRERRN